MPPGVVWFRRDLRLADHEALTATVAAHGEVVGLFVVDPLFTRRAGAPRRAFLHDCLRALDGAMDGALVVRHGDPAEVVRGTAAEVGAPVVYVTRDDGPYGRERDAALADALRADGRRMVGIGSPYAVAPGAVRKADGAPYAMFTPYFAAWTRTARPAPVGPAGDIPWAVLRGDGLPPRPDPGVELPPAGERVALDTWSAFRDGGSLAAYAARRDRPAESGSSHLSPYLKWGAVHPRRVLADIDDLASGADDTAASGHRAFSRQLAWREFYADVLFHRPDTAWSNLDRRMDAMVVDTDAAAHRRFERWVTGTTGFPIVDAGMRQLAATGWMHNRARMITASFLVKDLHLPWQWGARHFMRHLVDGDLASNNYGWQWVAGTGTDAAPYVRVLNPWTQAERFDPDGTYVAHWLGDGDDARRRPPMLDHATERAEALARHEAARRR